MQIRIVCHLINMICSLLKLQDEQSAVSMLKKHQILEQAVEDYAETVHQLSKTSRTLVADNHPERWLLLFCIYNLLLFLGLVRTAMLDLFSGSLRSASFPFLSSSKLTIILGKKTNSKISSQPDLDQTSCRFPVLLKYSTQVFPRSFLFGSRGRLRKLVLSVLNKPWFSMITLFKKF